MAAQRQVYGYNFIQELLPPPIIEDLQKSLPMQPDPTNVESVEYLYAQYVINRQITAIERTDLLAAIGKQHPLDLYTPDQTFTFPGCIIIMDLWIITTWLPMCLKMRKSI